MQASGIIPSSVRRRLGRPPCRLGQCWGPQGTVRKGQPLARGTLNLHGCAGGRRGIAWRACGRTAPAGGGAQTLLSCIRCGACHDGASTQTRPSAPPPDGSSCPAHASWPGEMSLEVNVHRYLPNCLERRGGLAEDSIAAASPATKRPTRAALLGRAAGRPAHAAVVQALPAWPPLRVLWDAFRPCLCLHGDCVCSSLPALHASGQTTRCGGRDGPPASTLVIDAWNCAPPAASMLDFG